MKRRNFGGFFSGMLATLLIVAMVGSVSATTGKVTKEIEYRNISVSLDGTKLNLKDAAGNTVEPFMFGGTNYVPARAIAEALGMTVSWDSANSTVVLKTKSSSSGSGTTSTTRATTSQKNALASAKSYLSFSAFSYTGLIEQLEYEKYSTNDATYAADNCGADWNEQAAKSAKSYLSISSFSRQGLIDQLLYEGFTQAQAEYGVSKNGY